MDEPIEEDEVIVNLKFAKQYTTIEGHINVYIYMNLTCPKLIIRGHVSVCTCKCV